MLGQPDLVRWLSSRGPGQPRRFSADYKARILAEYEHLSNADKGALMRRVGLCSSIVTEWRRQADQGANEPLGRSSGRQPTDPRDRFQQH